MSAVGASASPREGLDAPVDRLRLLVVQTAYLGDLVLTLPLLQALRRRWPAAKISVVTTELGRELLTGQALVDELFVLDKRGFASGLKGSWAVARELRARHFDAAIATHRSWRTGLLIRASGARLRSGFARAPGAWAYTVRLPWVAADHAARRYLSLASPLDVSVDGADDQPRLRVDPRAKRRVDELLRGLGVPTTARIACIAPGSIWATKRWTPEGFAAVADALERRGLRAVLVGAATERPLCEFIAARCAQPVTVLAGRTRLGELVALLARARVVVANDSGAGHVAAAVGAPLLSVFGPTVPEQGYVARGASTRTVAVPSLECRPCGRHGAARCPRAHHRCMRDLAPEVVIAALDEVIRGEERAAGPPAVPPSSALRVAAWTDETLRSATTRGSRQSRAVRPR